MLQHLKNSLRLIRTGLILARHDALFPLGSVNKASCLLKFCKLFAKNNKKLSDGERLSNALVELGPSYVKFGQSISTRSDIIGEDIAKYLANLRDNLPAFSTDEAIEIIEKDFEKPINQLFSKFDEKPIAAASIAQVHFAITNEGEEVAVKVVRPDVRAKFDKDIELFNWLAQILNKRDEFKRFKPIEVVKEFSESVDMELDLRLEASSASELRENTKNDTQFYVPKIHWELTSSKVMTSERIGGIKISDIKALKAKGHNLNNLVQIAAESFFMQVFRDGYFHADLHPGNLFVLNDGRIAAVDFGIMGRVSLQERIYLAEILHGFMQGDYRKVAQMHFTAGYVPSHKSVDKFTTACRAIGEPVLGLPMDKISVARLLEQLFAVAASFEMQVQPQLLLLQKTMMVAEGVGRTLAPDVNMWQLAEPLVVDWAKENLSVKAHIKSAAGKAGNMIETIPETILHAQNMLKKIDNGGLKLHPDTVSQFISGKKQNKIVDLKSLLLGITITIIIVLIK